MAGKRNKLILGSTLVLLLLIGGGFGVVTVENEANLIYAIQLHINAGPPRTPHIIFGREFDIELRNTRIRKVICQSAPFAIGKNYYIFAGEYCVITFGATFQDQLGFGMIGIARIPEEPVGNILSVITAKPIYIMLRNDSNGNGKIDLLLDQNESLSYWERVSETDNGDPISWFLQGDIDYFREHPELGNINSGITNFTLQDLTSTVENDTTVLHYGYGGTAVYDHANDHFQNPENFSSFDYHFNWAIQAKIDSPTIDIKFDMVLGNFSIAANQIANYQAPLLNSYWMLDLVASKHHALGPLVDIDFNVQDQDIIGRDVLLESVNFSHVESNSIKLSDFSFGSEYLLNNNQPNPITNIMAVLNTVTPPSVNVYGSGKGGGALALLYQTYNNWTLDDSINLDPLIRGYFNDYLNLQWLLIPVIAIPVGIVMSSILIRSRRERMQEKEKSNGLNH